MRVRPRSIGRSAWRDTWQRRGRRWRRCVGELDEDPAATSRRLAAARQRAGEGVNSGSKRRWRSCRRSRPRRRPRTGTRVSTTDPDSRVMKMADGGFRPAFNGQFATDTATQVIVGVDASNVGSDLGQAAPMVEQIPRGHQRVRQRDRPQSRAPAVPGEGSRESESHPALVRPCSQSDAGRHAPAGRRAAGLSALVVANPLQASPPNPPSASGARQ